MTRKLLSPFNVAITAIFTGLVCIATIVISVYIPTTRGFFNIGECMVFLAALLFGPAVGAFAGGVGSALADLLLGYWYYAPATLLIKAAEGYTVGLIRSISPKFRSNARWKLFTSLLGMITGGLLAAIGYSYYSGQIVLTLGFTVFLLFIPAELWLILGILVAFFIAAIGFVAEPEFGWSVLSVIVGGLVMVTGYYLYQMFFIGWLFNIQVVAIAEIPINLGQMIVGATIALPIMKITHRVFPYIRPREI